MHQAVSSKIIGTHEKFCMEERSNILQGFSNHVGFYLLLTVGAAIAFIPYFEQKCID